MKRRTPVSRYGLRQYDHLDPCEAAVRAWTVPGRRPEWHRDMQESVREEMPVLARALDRMAEGSR